MSSLIEESKPQRDLLQVQAANARGRARKIFHENQRCIITYICTSQTPLFYQRKGNSRDRGGTEHHISGHVRAFYASDYTETLDQVNIKQENERTYI